MSEQWTEITAAPIDLKKDPGPHTGTYVGTRERPGKYGIDYIHSFAGEDGEWTCYGILSLNNALKRVPKGTPVRITFRGKKKTKDGKRDFNDVSVQVPQGVNLDMDGAAAASADTDDLSENYPPNLPTDFDPDDFKVTGERPEIPV